jgi:ATP-dependent Clp protease ATP-binding subunit ClpA
MSGRFDKFTERAKKVLVLAQEEAQRFNHRTIGTEHLLLGLVGEGRGVAARVLRGVGIDAAAAREALVAVRGRGREMVVGDIGLTPRAKRAIELAVEESRRLHHRHVGTEHLLLALLRLEDGTARRLLERLGAAPEGLRARVLEAEGVAETGAAAAPAAVRPRDHVVTCRVDDRALEALDAFVEAGVYTTRSEAAARLILAGLDANRPLLQQVRAAVAEIRRVREETRKLTELWEAGPGAAEGPGAGPATEDDGEDGGEGGDAGDEPPATSAA